MTAIDATPVTLDVGSDGIARLGLNRPEASNGLNVELLKALHEAILRCHADASVRVVLLSGEGRNFCAGGDIHTFESKGAELPHYLREATAWLQLATSALIQLRVPVVTAVQGFAAGGGGLGLVCASDIVVAAESAKFFSGAVRVGMAPDGGSSVTLTQLVGLRQALRILLLNPTLSAAEALRDRPGHRDGARRRVIDPGNRNRHHVGELADARRFGHQTPGVERVGRLG